MEQKYELYHYGILGMKWGVRRFQNEDGSLTTAGKKRYNEDSDNLARYAGEKYSALRNFYAKKEAVEKSIYGNPGKFRTDSKEAIEYADAAKRAEAVFDRAAEFIASLSSKYSKVDYDIYTEAKTGEQYVRSILRSKEGQEYISEFYLGYVAKDFKPRKDTKMG